jgi:hypothetical protein
MPFTKLPLKQRIERTNSPHGFGWDEFQKIMRMPASERPSINSIARMYGVAGKTAKSWIMEWEEGK